MTRIYHNHWLKVVSGSLQHQ